MFSIQAFKELFIWAPTFCTSINITNFVEVAISYHDSMREVAIGLALQTHSGELSCYIALWGGLVQGGFLDTSHFSDHKEGEHALQEQEKKRKKKKAASLENMQSTPCRLFKSRKLN